MVVFGPAESSSVLDAIRLVLLGLFDVGPQALFATIVVAIVIVVAFVSCPSNGSGRWTRESVNRE